MNHLFRFNMNSEREFVRKKLHFPSESPADDAERESAVLTGISSRSVCNEGARRAFLAWAARTAADKVG